MGGALSIVPIEEVCLACNLILVEISIAKLANVNLF